MPGLYPEDQKLSQTKPVKPVSEDQKLSGNLSNHPVAAGGWRAEGNSTLGEQLQRRVRQPKLIAPAGTTPRNPPPPLAHPSNRVIAQLNAKWRVVDDPLQWILQRRKGNPRKKNSGWLDRSFCTTRDGLLRCVRENCGEVDDDALSELQALPEFHPDREQSR
jgi:hypothetical protein